MFLQWNASIHHGHTAYLVGGEKETYVMLAINKRHK
jgi:hypothetical protein